MGGGIAMCFIQKGVPVVLKDAKQVRPSFGGGKSYLPTKNMEYSSIVSGEIIATSHDLTPNGGLVREIPLFQGNLGW